MAPPSPSPSSPFAVAALAVTDPQVSNALAGAGAGAIAATIVCPLDVLKTRLQVSTLAAETGNAYVSTTQSLANIARTEGIVGLYRGLTPTIVALLPNWAVYFTVYESLKHAMEADGPKEGSATRRLRRRVRRASRLESRLGRLLPPGRLLLPRRPRVSCASHSTSLRSARFSTWRPRRAPARRRCW